MALGNSLFGAAKLTKNPDADKSSFSRYGIWFDAEGLFSLSDGSGFIKNVIILGANMSSSVHIKNKKKKYFDSWWRSNRWIRWYYKHWKNIL